MAVSPPSSANDTLCAHSTPAPLPSNHTSREIRQGRKTQTTGRGGREIRHRLEHEVGVQCAEELTRHDEEMDVGVAECFGQLREACTRC